MNAPGSPPPPSRTRMVRPSLYRSESTGALLPDVRDLLIGLMTMADDEGWLLWSPGEIAATLYSYAPAAKRLKDLDRRATKLEAKGLIERRPCGCAYLPTLKEHHGIKGGEKTTVVWAWHQKHAHSVGLHSATDESVSVSVSDSGSSSSSESVQASASSRAREIAPSANGAAALCDECHRPTSVHSSLCSRSPHLRTVAL